MPATPEKRIRIEAVELRRFHCAKCGKVLAKLNLIHGEIIIEIKCEDCGWYSTAYLNKK